MGKIIEIISVNSQFYLITGLTIIAIIRGILRNNKNVKIRKIPFKSYLILSGLLMIPLAIVWLLGNGFVYWENNFYRAFSFIPKPILVVYDILISTIGYKFAEKRVSKYWVNSKPGLSAPEVQFMVSFCGIVCGFISFYFGIMLFTSIYAVLRMIFFYI